MRADRDRCSTDREKKLREESAKMFAVKLKAIEDAHHHQLEELQRSVYELRHELEQTQCAMEMRCSEVQILKKAILSEREKITEILVHKDGEAKIVFDRQNAKIDALSKELNDRCEQFDAERNSIRKVMEQRLQENTILVSGENKLKDLIGDLKTQHSRDVEQLNEKYQSAKRTAANYKVHLIRDVYILLSYVFGRMLVFQKYSEAKDKHILQENDRIKLAYEAAVRKAQEKAELAYKEKLDKLSRYEKNTK